MARKIRAKEILRLRDAGLSRTSIAKTQHMSKTSVCDVFDAADRLGMSWEDVRDKAEEDVYRALFPERNIEEDPFDEPDWERVHSEMAKVGVTLKLLHAEYADQCAERHVAAMSYDRFCKRYRRWTAVQGISSRVGHKAATIVEVDWSGPTMRIVDPGTGEVQKVYLFVACLPFSRYAYVEPTLDMKEGTWLRCHVRMFAFFGGGVPCIVPDNLRTGIRKHPKEGEPELNDAYREMAAHYGCAVMPARVRKPKDKPSVENTVGNIATAIIAKLRGREFTSLDQLASAVRGALGEYNAAPFQKRPGSRKEIFESEEKPLLRPLPAIPYEVCRWVLGRKVQMNSHVSYRKCFYSVPCAHVGETVDLKVTDTTLEVWKGGERLSTHALFPPYATNRYATNGADMPAGRSYSDWDAARIRSWASRIGDSCSAVIERIFQSVQYEEQGFNACLSVLRLSHRYGSARLEAACAIALRSGARSPRYRQIKPILETGQDLGGKDRQPGDDAHEDGGWVRGAGYYGEE